MSAWVTKCSLGKKRKQYFTLNLKKIKPHDTPCVVRHRMNLSFLAFHTPEPPRITKNYITALFALNKMNPEQKISSGYFMAVCLLLWHFSWLHSTLQTNRSFHQWWLIIFLFANPPAKNVSWFLKENSANKSITSSAVIREWLTHLGLSWLTRSSTSSHSATQSNKRSLHKLLWLITTFS